MGLEVRVGDVEGNGHEDVPVPVSVRWVTDESSSAKLLRGAI